MFNVLVASAPTGFAVIVSVAGVLGTRAGGAGAVTRIAARP